MGPKFKPGHSDSTRVCYTRHSDSTKLEYILRYVEISLNSALYYSSLRHPNIIELHSVKGQTVLTRQVIDDTMC